MSKDDDLAQAEALLAHVQRGKVVSLRRVRRVTNIVRRLRSDDAAQSLLASLASELLDSVRWWEGRLIDRVEKVCQEHPATDVPDLAGVVAKDREFQRLNREIRWQRAVYLKEDMPEVHVRAHIRDGGEVREHWRLVGYGHLADIDVEERLLKVRTVLNYLITGKHRHR